MGFFSRFLNGQMIFERMETRILVGITMFVATMMLIGWVAINEGARMAAFDRQFAARSIERGAAMFSTYCSTCHGNNGEGIAGRAPALNNPQLFGHDFMPEISTERNSLIAERTQLENESQGSPAPTEERLAEIDTRLTEVNNRIADLEQQALPFIQQSQQAALRGYDIYRPNRLTNVEWSSNLFNYVYSTLVHGRPVSSAYWENPMPNWAQVSGGPLRDDQLRDLTNFVLNWNRDFTIEDLLAVQQFAVEPCNPTSCVGGGAESVNDVIADPEQGIEGLRTQFDAAEANAENGDALYHGLALTGTGTILGCAGCHVGAVQGPDLIGTWTRVLDERLPILPDYADGQEYLIHSIIRPGEYVVPTYADGVMPSTFGNQLTVQDLADIVAYLMTQ